MMPDSIFPRPQRIRERTEHGLRVAGDTTISATEAGWAEASKLNAWLKRDFGLDLPVTALSEGGSGTGADGIVAGLMDDPLIKSLLDEEGISVDDRAQVHEGYVLGVSSDRVLVAGFDAPGLFYGLQLLRQLAVRDGEEVLVGGAEVHDWPYKSMRGVHLYMPGREDLPFFYRLLELLASLRYNQVYVEVGGGMRFDRHPEINGAWEEFVEAARSFEEGPEGLQRSQPFPKDSTHTELGRGSFLEKDEVRAFIEYGRSLHIEFLPEVPALSHAYYLVCPHPEIAERPEDPYPDTYCPSNPASYELLFDVIDEVIEVFEPRIVHVGHDEVYSYGLCPRCRDKSGAELIAGDISRIHGYLAERGVRMAMWGDKLMDIVVGGSHEGGRERRVGGGGWFGGGAEYVMAETYQARDEAPKDILILDWYWSLDSRSERYFGKLGFEEIFGNFGQNFGAAQFTGWDQRASAPNVLGAEVSTWCGVSEFAMARNACLFNFLFSAEMFWWRHYTDRERARVLGAIADLQPAVRDFLGDRHSPSRTAGAQHSPVALANAGNVTADFGSQLPDGIAFLGGAPYRFSGARSTALRVDAGNHHAGPVAINAQADSLLFVHHCQCDRKYGPTWAFVDPLLPSPEDRIGQYTVHYDDGTHTTVEIRYGENIANRSVRFGESIASTCYWAEPVWEGTDEEGLPIVLYRYEWINPYPEKEIASVGMTFDDGIEGYALLAALTAVREL